jgi:hypothetical protein
VGINFHRQGPAAALSRAAGRASIEGKHSMVVPPVVAAGEESRHRTIEMRR